MTTFHPIPVEQLRPQMATWTVAQYHTARTTLLQRAAQYPVILPQVENYVRSLDSAWQELQKSRTAQMARPVDNSAILAAGTVGVVILAGFVLSPWALVIPAAVGLAVRLGRSGVFHSHGVGDVEAYWHGYNAGMKKEVKTPEAQPRRVIEQKQTITEF